MSTTPAKPAPDRLRKRADFLRARSGSTAAGAFVRVQMAESPSRDGNTARLGFTVTKKNGNAVKRNRIKRRLRAAAVELPADMWANQFDYVVISKPEALIAPFDALKADLAAAISKAERRLRHHAKSH